MTAGSDTAPAWLFSFVDLAFLLLISLTQVGGGPRAVDLGEMVVPRVNQEATASLSAGATERWQLRIHPPVSSDAGPFELLAPGRADGAGAHLAAAALREQLGRLHEANAPKPLLAPTVRTNRLVVPPATSIGRWLTSRPASLLAVTRRMPERSLGDVTSTTTG